MVGIIFGYIGYLMSNAVLFGQSVLDGLTIVSWWYWIIFYFLAFLAFIMFAFFMLTGAHAGEKIGGPAGKVGGLFTGSLIGVITAGILLFKTMLQLYLLEWLITDISPNAIGFDMLTPKQTFGLYSVLILAFLPVGFKQQNRNWWKEKL